VNRGLGMSKMTQERFDELVSNIEGFALQNPETYKRRVAGLAALGYAYIGLIVTLTLALCVVLIILLVSGHFSVLVIKLELFFAGLLYFTIRSLFVRLNRPDGIELTRSDVPDLFDVINSITDKLKAPRFHYVLVNHEYNAGVAQVPKFGIVGPSTSYLTIGMPLLASLSEDQLVAVLAHELGHLSGNHGKFAGRIYRLRTTWQRLLTELHSRRHRGVIIFTKFFDWYAPYFVAYSFTLARLNEYEADRCSVEVAGRETVAATLSRTSLMGDVLENTFSPSVGRLINSSPVPPANYFTMMRSALATAPPTDKAVKTVREELNLPTSSSDTHPSLRDRLEAIGIVNPEPDQLAALALAPPVHPAEYLLGDRLVPLVESMSSSWRLSVEQGWNRAHEAAVNRTALLARLEDETQSRELSDSELWERATLTAQVRGNAEALPLFRECLKSSPGNPNYQFTLASLLLEEEDESGIDLMSAAMNSDQTLVLRGCGILYTFLARRGRHLEAAAYRGQFHKRSDLLEEAKAERSTISK